MSSTPKGIVVIVVTTLAILATVGVCSLAGTLFFKNYADPAVLTAFISITSAAIGSLSSLLVNTRQPAQNGSTVSVVTTSETPKPSTITVEPEHADVEKPKV